MKKTYLVTAFGLSILLFAGVFMGSFDHYRLKQKSRSPFLNAISLEEPISTEANKIKTLLTQGGEYVVVFANSSLGATKHKKVIENGNVYLTGYFTNSKDLQKNLELFETSEPRYPVSKTAPGQVQVGEHLIHYGDGSTLISRNAEEGITEIYSIDHEIRVFYEGAEKPFVLPPHMKITIVDAKINDNTAKLYYSKLRKKTEFRLQTYQEDVSLLDREEAPTEPSLATARGKIDYALGKRKNAEKAMEQYVQYYIPLLQKHPSETFLGKLTFQLKSLQSKLALVKPKSYKHKIQFLTFIQSFIDAVYAAEEGNGTKAQNKLAQFIPVQNNPDWISLLEESPKIKSDWVDFSRAQSSLLRKMLPEEDEYVFYNFWFGSLDPTPWAEFKSEFFAIQNFIAQKSYDQTPERFSRLSNIIDNLDPESTPAQGITDYRRLMTELLKYDPYFKEEMSIFQSLITLSEKEVDAYEDELLSDEATLEIAQDLLYFMRQFLAQDTINQKLLELLEARFRSIDIGQISRRIGRDQIFSPQELEVMDFIDCASGSLGLTEDRIKRCKEQKNRIDQGEVIDFSELNEEDETTKKDWKRIETNKDFKSYLVTLNINTSNLKFQNASNNKNFLFSGAYFDVHRLRGIFNYNGQYFERTHIGEKEFARLTLPEFERALHSVRSQTNTKAIKPEQKNIIPQTTPEAKYQRLLLLKMLEKEGFTVSMDDIRILDKDFQTFRASNVVSPDRYISEFVYHKDKDFVSDIRVKYGSSTRNFRHIKYPFNKLRDELDNAILPKNTR